jgi:uncharacterized protein YodC (DUF2158 family)
MFHPGDVVQLRSRGVEMTVESIEDSSIRCVWLNQHGDVCRELFGDWTLEKADTRKNAFPNRNPRTGLPTL